jgi:hypothetical protein
MYRILVLFFVLMLQSCQWFNKKAPSEEARMNEEIQKINWTSVDQYPSFEACDSLEHIEAQKNCFFDTYYTAIQNYNTVGQIRSLFPKLDTIILKVKVNKDAQIDYWCSVKDTTFQEETKIDSIIRKDFAALPKIVPAQKKGMLVTSEFQLPIAIK